MTISDKQKKGAIYTELLLNAGHAKDIIERYDEGNKGYLVHEEVLAMLKDQERKSGRDVDGIVVTLVVTRSDVKACLKLADMGTKQHIKAKHLVPILEAWEEMAEEKIQEQRDRKCCIIL